MPEYGVVEKIVGQRSNNPHAFVCVLDPEGCPTNEVIFFSPKTVRKVIAQFRHRAPLTVVSFASRRAKLSKQDRFRVWDNLKVGDRIVFQTRPDKDPRRLQKRAVAFWTSEAVWNAKLGVSPVRP